jgi:hypothetical protein
MSNYVIKKRLKVIDGAKVGKPTRIRNKEFKKRQTLHDTKIAFWFGKLIGKCTFAAKFVQATKVASFLRRLKSPVRLNFKRNHGKI